MTIENLATIEDVRKYHFDPKEVIKGLNGYYESDKCNSYITVRRNDVEGPAYLSTNLWLSALIEWLREDYDIFYRPGLTIDQVEAARNAAKMCSLRAHIKDELSKRDLWFDKNADIPELVDTLFKAYDECNKDRDRNRENAAKLSEENQELKKELNALKDSQKSDANKLIRDCCANHGIIAPSRYLSDEASVEYVFSLLDSYSKQRNEACANRYRAVDNYKLNLKDYILKNIKKHGYRYDGLETKSIEVIVDWIIEMATCANKEVEDVQKETKRKCYWYLWEALKKLSPECDALKIDCYENLVDRIFYEMSLIPDNCKRCQRKHSTEKFDYIRRANKAEEEVKKLNDVIKKLKELLNEINKEEDNEWFKP